MQEAKRQRKRYLLSLLLCLAVSSLLVTANSCSFNKDQNQRLLRLGYMPNVTHATALVGIEKNIFQDEIGSEIKLKPLHFVVGNNIIDAFITNQIDIAYIGPGPFINAFYRKVPVKLLANACNGGTVIVGKNGPRIAVPQYGNTQDLILRSYLEKNNLLEKTKIIAIPTQDIGTAFFTMSIDAACVPEPWGTILIKKNMSELIKDEKSILNNGNYPVTLLIVNKEFEKNNSELIKRFLIAHEKANSFIVNNKEEAINVVTKAISDISKKEVEREIIAESFKRCSFNTIVDFDILKNYITIGVKSGYYKNENYFN